MTLKQDRLPPASASISPSPYSTADPAHGAHYHPHALVRSAYPASNGSASGTAAPTSAFSLPPQHPDSTTETEDAAQVLEDLALGGRRPYKSLGINSEVPTRPPAGPTVIQPGAFTSIFVPFSSTVPVSFDSASLMRALPKQNVAQALVGIYFAE